MSLQPADRGWIVLGASVLLWDLWAPEGQTLSEGADKYMLHHPWWTRAVGVALLGHVCNVWPARLDPIHGLFVLSRKWRRG